MKNPIKIIREYKERLDWPLKVCLEDRYPDTVIYRLLCSCGEREHDATLWFEREKEMPHLLSLRIYTKSVQYGYFCSGFWEDLYWLWRRIKASFWWIVSGYIELETEISIEGKDHIRNIRDALDDAIKFLEVEETPE